jgi:hypothetical protein
MLKNRFVIQCWNISIYHKSMKLKSKSECGKQFSLKCFLGKFGDFVQIFFYCDKIIPILFLFLQFGEISPKNVAESISTHTLYLGLISAYKVQLFPNPHLVNRKR